VGIQRKRVNWVLDADIRGFFDNMSHEWTMKFIEHRVADRRMLRLIQKWLKAGVSEDGQWSETKVGTPQGAVVSPLLANVYLHYVFDLWVEAWRKKIARGDVIVVRYADDRVVGFQNRADAERFLAEFRERLVRFGLELHPDKTRLIEFGRFAVRDRKRRGEGKPETFTFLGFTHFCGHLTSSGAFNVWRITAKKRMVAKLNVIKAELQHRKHHRTSDVGAWLRKVAGLLPVPRGARQHGSVARLQTARMPIVAERFSPSQSARAGGLGSPQPTAGPVDSCPPRSAPLSR
jgi:group II intron reverse transcriptase/maturase